MKPLISYYGGKQRIASKIVPLLPPHTVYVEPFAGGAAVFFAKGRPPVTNNDFYREVLNDTLGQLITLYRVATLQPNALQQRIEATLHSRRDYERACAIYKNPNDHDDLTVAWATYVGYTQSFAKNPGAGWAMGTKSESNAATWENRKKNIDKTIKRLAGVHIEQRDALHVIQAWDSPQTLFYCDPPYPNTTQGHYHGYTQADFEALIETLSNCQGSVVLSGYPNDAVPADWTCHEFATRMSASNGRQRKTHDTKRTECVWVVDRSANMPDDLAKIATHYAALTQRPVIK